MVCYINSYFAWLAWQIHQHYHWSCTESSSGAGTFSLDLEIRFSFPLGELTTAFQAEIFPILMATGIMIDHGITGQAILGYVQCPPQNADPAWKRMKS